MESIYLLIPLILAFTVLALFVYIWAVNSGQYDDLDKEAQQLLFDKDENMTPPSPGDTFPTEQGRL